MARKRLSNGPAPVQRNALQGRSQAQPAPSGWDQSWRARRTGSPSRRAGALAVAKQSDRPGPDVLARVIEQPLRGRFVEAAGRVQRPECAQATADFRIGREDLAKRAIRLAQVFPGERPLLKQPPGRSHVPVVLVELIIAPGQDRSRRKDRPSPAAASRKRSCRSARSRGGRCRNRSRDTRPCHTSRSDKRPRRDRT